MYRQSVFLLYVFFKTYLFIILGQRLPGSASRSTASTNTSSPGTTVSYKYKTYIYKNKTVLINIDMLAVTHDFASGVARVFSRLNFIKKLK